MTEDNLHGAGTGNNHRDPRSSCSPMSLVSVTVGANHRHHHHHHHQRFFGKLPSATVGGDRLGGNPIICPLVDITDGKLLHPGIIIGPIPNLFKWLQTELNRVEKDLECLPAVNSSSTTVVELALTKEEQNLEIVFYNEQYYFEVIRLFRIDQKNGHHHRGSNSVRQPEFECGDEKPKAWFCQDIEERFSIRPAQTWINGKELFCCLMCNHFSFYHNHLLLHIMLDCPKQNGFDSSVPRSSGAVRNGETAADKKPKLANDLTGTAAVAAAATDDQKHQIRSFDIISLLNRNNDHHPTHRNHVVPDDTVQTVDDEEMVDVETLEEETTPTIKFSNKNDSFVGKPKREIRSTIYPNHSKFQPATVRRYTAKKMSPLSIMTGSSKSAFRKLGGPTSVATSSRSKGGSKNPSATIAPPPSSFISNLQLSNFYNQLVTNSSSSENGTTGVSPSTTAAVANNPALFTHSFVNLFSRNQANGGGDGRSISPLPSSSLAADQPSLLYSPFRSGLNSNAAGNNQATKQGTSSFEPTTSSAVVNGGSSLESHSPTLSDHSSEHSSPRPFSETKDNNRTKVSQQDELSSDSSSMIQLLPQSAQNIMANNPLFNLPPYFMPPTTAAASNPLITSLYLLSPSLTALSYQASNVCAYCNTAFRMTSDLVYHMRSHHKKTRMDDGLNKKRRDDQLRCHICQETFRERHHLTRHMTSHQ